jgi:hypothetical protein
MGEILSVIHQPKQALGLQYDGGDATGLCLRGPGGFPWSIQFELEP